MDRIRELSRCGGRVRRGGALGMLAVLLLAGAGCAGTGGAIMPTTAANREFKCVGAGMDRRTCSTDAARLCYTGFTFFEKEAAGDDGVVRNGLYFRCNP